jgi:hypothetical protein
MIKISKTFISTWQGVDLEERRGRMTIANAEQNTLIQVWIDGGELQEVYIYNAEYHEASQEYVELDGALSVTCIEDKQLFYKLCPKFIWNDKVHDTLTFFEDFVDDFGQYLKQEDAGSDFDQHNTLNKTMTGCW